MKSHHFNTVQPITMKIDIEGFCAILFVAALHQVALQHINFCIVQSIAKLPTWLPKVMPTWLYRQNFAMFPLNRHYNWRTLDVIMHTPIKLKRCSKAYVRDKSHCACVTNES
ncbi:UNVERIFIED_CONTAM: hypothetical protein NCL1_11076 [Trichonephila clavipes]